MTPTPRGSTAPGARAFRLLLGLYPAAFRDEYGRELALVFADRYRDARGGWARADLWLEAAAGVLADAPREHGRALLRDVRYALRSLRRAPGFALTAIVTLALAIGASAAMFGVLDAVLLRPLPYPRPDRLVMVWLGDGRGERVDRRAALGAAEAWARGAAGAVDLAVYDPASITVRAGGEAERVGAARVSPELFALLGLGAARGRVLTADDAAARRPVAVVSDRFWRTRLGGRADAVNAAIEVDGRVVEVAGILAEQRATPGFDADVWLPHTLAPDVDRQRAGIGPGPWFVVGRLRDGVTAAQAQAALAAADRPLAAQLSAGARERTLRVAPLDEHITPPRVRLVLWLLMAAAVALLVVAAANVAGLSLARGVGRLPELAIRAALGAGRAQVVRLLVAEGLTIAAIAAVLGAVLAPALNAVIAAAGPPALLPPQGLAIDARALVWAAVAASTSGLLVGLAPAAVVWRRDLRAALGSGGRGVAGGVGTRLRRGLVVAESAVAIALLVGAGLLVHSWWRLQRVDAGFDAGRVLALSVTAPASPGLRSAFYDALIAQVAAVPGVARAGVSSELFVGSVAERVVIAEGVERSVPLRLPVRSDEVSAGFFDAIGTPVLRGRRFSSADGPESVPVAIVNATFARRVWPDADPVGRRFRLAPAGPDAPWLTVVGVVGDMRRQGLEAEPIAQLFVPLAQQPPGRAIVFVRAAAADPRLLAPSLRAAIRRVDPQAIVYRVETLEQQIGASLAQRRLQTTLLTLFACVALALAGLGIHGVMHHAVLTRTHEIGIRLALGARPRQVAAMIIREGVGLGLAGLAIGLAGGWLLGQAGASLLFGVRPADPLTLGVVSLLVVGVSAAACALPARRAGLVEPLSALRQRVG